MNKRFKTAQATAQAMATPRRHKAAAAGAAGTRGYTMRCALLLLLLLAGAGMIALLLVSGGAPVAWLAAKSNDDAGYHAAGFLLIARDTAPRRTGETAPEMVSHERDYVLLGLDFHTNRWADFGGLRDPLDEDPDHTACRELHEEIAGLLHMTKTPDECRRYAAKCTMSNVTYVVQKRGTLMHHYVLAVPYTPDLPNDWPPPQTLYTWLLFPHEKEKLQWVPLTVFENDLSKCCESDDEDYSTCHIGGLWMRQTVVGSLCRHLRKDANAFNPDRADTDCF